MIAIEDIKDGESLKEWLTEWPKTNGLDKDATRAVAVTIAHRAAMRLLPVFWQWCVTGSARMFGSTALPFLRSCLISGVTAKMPTPELKNAAAAAAAARATTTATAATAFVAATAAASAAAASTTSATIDAAANTNSAQAVAFWVSLQSDCDTIAHVEDALAMPLWLIGENPLEDSWHEVVNKEKGPEWAFWIKWYEDALAGHPQNWKMLEKIALIDPEIWEAGPYAVSERIAEILELHRLRAEVATLQAERDEFHSRVATAAHRSHNQPPDLVDSDFDLARETTIIWVGLDDASQELEKDEPDKGVLGKIAKQILSAIASVTRYCGKIADTAIMAAAKVGGGAVVTWVVDYIVNNGRLLQFAKDLLNFSGGG